MAGIYIHIPYCQQACHYCDFHFSTQTSGAPDMLRAIIKELQIQRNYLKDAQIDTIYIGGGTPSHVLDRELLIDILHTIKQHYNAASVKEITIEANPEDLSTSYLEMLLDCGINRLSIGVQTFNQNMLTKINRVHNAEQAIQSITDAASLGFKNISIDLMYGLPEQSLIDWETEVHTALDLPITHLSAYCLTVSPKTVFNTQLKRNLLELPDEEIILKQFQSLVKIATTKGYIQYEICSFCKNEKFKSQHNSSYWRNELYLGVGPSAHSYNYTSRQWNIKNNLKYVKKISENDMFYEVEEIDDKKRFNELILTSLRTREGVLSGVLLQKFDSGFVKHFETGASRYISSGHMNKTIEGYTLSLQGQLIADRIAMDLFID